MAHFELLEDKLLGEGSFGKVYQCRWHGSLAAAKQFNIVEADETSELMEEIKMIEKLRNDYIIQLIGKTHHNGKLCLITSYAENGSLRHALSNHTLSDDLKPSIITGLIRGMHYLKMSNVIHRDLKSPNVLLGPNYVPKVCDFGLELLKLNSASLTKTTSSTVGALRWMAPELLLKRPHYSFASDVYALGVVIWEIFTENVPYAETIDNEIVKGFIQNGEHEAIPDNIPEHYKSIIKNCWHLDPEDRISVEDISKLDDGTRFQADTVFDNGISDKDPAVSTQAISINSEHTSSQQRSAISHFPMRDAANEQESTGYKQVLKQYIQDTGGVSDSRDQLAAILDMHGDGFIQWIKTEASHGNNDAATVLGEVHYYGCGVPQDYQTAIKQFSSASVEKTCGQGNPRAQYNLGLMYDNGQGVPQDVSKAVEWYKKAAEQGNEHAQFELGQMYQKGRGLPKKDNKAAKWYTKAAEQGNANAQHKLGGMYMFGEGVPRDDGKAIEWFKKAAEQGNVKSVFTLGWMYETGRGVPQSYYKAFEWYMKAADQGFVAAQFNLGVMYEYGRGTAENDHKAAEWYTKAAEMGYADAQFNLGLMYENGRGVPQDDKKTVEWFSKALEQGHYGGEKGLARMKKKLTRMEKKNRGSKLKKLFNVFIIGS